MAVYVDELWDYGTPANPTAARFGRRWCHLYADDPAELHDMAARIGLRRAWFQDHKLLPHYDLVASKRALAVRLGATEVDMAFTGRRVRAARCAAQGLPAPTTEE